MTEKLYKIKPLVWETKYRALVDMGDLWMKYEIRKSGERYLMRLYGSDVFYDYNFDLESLKLNRDGSGIFESLEEAKEAAQKDWELKLQKVLMEVCVYLPPTGMLTQDLHNENILTEEGEEICLHPACGPKTIHLFKDK